MTPAARTADEQAQTLLAELAAATNVEAAAQTSANNSPLTWRDLRWWAVGNPPRAVVVVTRGKRPRTVKTISANATPGLWARWLPVLAELQTQRANNGGRANHEALRAKGEIE